MFMNSCGRHGHVRNKCSSLRRRKPEEADAEQVESEAELEGAGGGLGEHFSDRRIDVILLLQWPPFFSLPMLELEL
jgi:hypothetical protein